MYHDQFWLGDHLAGCAIRVSCLYFPDCHLASKRGRRRTCRQRLSVTPKALSQGLAIAEQTGKGAIIKFIPQGVFHFVVERDQPKVVLGVSGAICLFPLLVEGLKIKERNALCIRPLTQQIMKDFLLELVRCFRAFSSVGGFVDTRPAGLSDMHWLTNADRCHVLSHSGILIFCVRDCALHCRLSHRFKRQRLFVWKHSPERGVIKRIVKWVGVNRNKVDSSHELRKLFSVINRITATPGFIVIRGSDPYVGS